MSKHPYPLGNCLSDKPIKDDFQCAYQVESNLTFAQNVRRATQVDMYGWTRNSWVKPCHGFGEIPRVESRPATVLLQVITPSASPTEQAMREFIDRVKQIDVKVKIYGGTSPAEQSVIVEVPSILSQEARRVVRLQGEMYKKYPGASVRVDITEASDNVAQAER